MGARVLRDVLPGRAVSARGLLLLAARSAPEGLPLAELEHRAVPGPVRDRGRWPRLRHDGAPVCVRIPARRPDNAAPAVFAGAGGGHASTKRRALAIPSGMVHLALSD